MPTAVTTGPARPKQNGGQSQAVLPTVPFIRASAEHREPSGVDVSRLMLAADQDLGVFDIPAYGYLRSVMLLVQATGAAGSPVLNEDSVWAAIKNIALTEPNGAVLQQFNSGFDLMLAHKWGGYRDTIGADPTASPVYAVGGVGNFTFMLRIPVELNLRDGLGALPNQNAAATFKLKITLTGSTTVWSTVPTTLPTVRVRAFTEAWDQPETQSAGQQNQTTPPAMNTTQFWSSQTYNINAGAQTVRLTRVGNYLRNLIFVFRTAGTARSTGQTNFPDPATLYLDTRPLDIIEKNNWIHQMYERSGYGGAVGSTIIPGADTARGYNNGVFVYDFAHEFDGTLGMENRDLWLPTLGSTRLELQGSFGAAGTLTVLTNDVAIAGNVFI